MCVYIYIYIYIYAAAFGARRCGRAGADGAVALVADKWGQRGRCKSNEHFDRLGKKLRPGTFGKIKVV